MTIYDWSQHTILYYHTSTCNTYMRIGLNSKQTQNHFLFTRVLTIKNNASLWSWSIVFSTHTVIQGKLHEIYQIYTLLETQFTSFIFSVQEVQDIIILWYKHIYTYTNSLMSKAGSLCLWRTENLINISYENTKFGFMAFFQIFVRVVFDNVP